MVCSKHWENASYSLPFPMFRHVAHVCSMDWERSATACLSQCFDTLLNSFFYYQLNVNPSFADNQAGLTTRSASAD
jgi:hypothetical protein